MPDQPPEKIREIVRSTDRKVIEQRNVYTIPPGLPFLKTLCENLITGKLIPSFVPAEDPFSLGDCTLFLPTRRASRAMSAALLDTMHELTGIKSVVLPTIRTIGDLDEDEMLPGFSNIDLMVDARDLSAIGQQISPVERQLVFARLALQWTENFSESIESFFQEETIKLPSSSAEALKWANELGRLIDQMETEEIGWQALAKLLPEEKDLARWWEITLQFLKIVTQHWPEILSERGLVNPALWRRQLIDHRALQLMQDPPKGPVIAAGSTGSIPATARLIKTISEIENGAVVLPGLDLLLPEATRKQFCDEHELSGDTVSSTHSQFGLVRLLNKMNVPIHGVKTLGKQTKPAQLRDKIIQHVLLPAADSASWPEIRNRYDEKEISEAVENVTLLEARNEQHEALAIALVLRQALETPGKTAALVTPDRELAKRVSAELFRFGITIDDSAGIALIQTPVAGFLRALSRAAFLENDNVSLATVCSSVWFQRQSIAAQDASLGELLEIALLREEAGSPRLGEFSAFVTAAAGKIDKKFHAPNALKQLDAQQWQELADFGAHIDAATAAIQKLVSGAAPITIHEMADALLDCLSKCSGIDAHIENEQFMFGMDEMLVMLEAYRDCPSETFRFSGLESIPVFDALFAGQKVRRQLHTHPRLQIFGQLEARLQTADLFILAGLNEGTWPQATSNDVFLNRPMRSELALPLPERRIGLAAHDFSQFSGTPEVVYSRAAKVDDSPTVASRWLQRLQTFLGTKASDKLAARGEEYLQLADRLDDGPSIPIARPPEPRPPVSARPTSLSITETETWIRDPYAIYARHILELQPLPDLVRQADPALRGTLYHEILAEFFTDWQDFRPEQSLLKMNSIADLHFGKLAVSPEISANWRLRFNRIAEALLQYEVPRAPQIAARFCEVSTHAEIDQTGFVLRGRADRIDLDVEGRITILDYKTGTKPTTTEARTLSPQITLEGALAKRGKFDGIKAAPLKELAFVRLREGKDFKVEKVNFEKNDAFENSSEMLADQAFEELVKLIRAYENENQPYVSHYAPLTNLFYTSPYDHLARVNEWSLGEEVQDE